MREDPPRERDEPSEEEAFFAEAAPPSLHMPRKTTLLAAERASLDEQLFNIVGDLWDATPEQACARLLDLALERIPCEAGSVALGRINEECLTFVAATGSVADRIIGRKLDFGTGIMGLSYDQRVTIVMAERGGSAHHFTGVDLETGFSTGALLAVPIIDEEDVVYGVIELLNPTSRAFLDEDEEVVEHIAATLAGVLARE